MTARQIYENALANVSQFEKENDRWDSLALMWVNQAIDNVWLNNPDRFVEGVPVIREQDAPEVNDMDDEIDLPNSYKLALIYCVTSSLWEDAGEAYKAQDYYSRAKSALQQAQWLVPEEVIDCYG